MQSPSALSALGAALLLRGLLLSIFAPPASAAGVNLNWNDCIAGGFCPNKEFTCGVNTGASTMVGSYVSPAHIDSMCANEIVLDLATTGPTLPLWWNFQTGGCRAGSLTRSFDFTGGPTSCADHWAGNVTLTSLAYYPGYNGPSTARIVMAAAVPAASCSGPGGTGIAPGVEYYSFKLSINHARTVETGPIPDHIPPRLPEPSCDGCLVPVCIVLNEIKLYSPSRGTTPVQIYLTYPDVQQYVSWQGAGFSTAGCYPGGGPSCPGDDTPALHRTWGQVKSIYR